MIEPICIDPCALIITVMIDNIKGNSYAKTSFISRDAPIEASGFPELEAPMIKAIAGMVKRYNITIKSPLNFSEKGKNTCPRIFATRPKLKNPKKGAKRKVILADLGRMISLPNNLMISIKF